MWNSGFYIVNKTNDKIIITYSLTSDFGKGYALDQVKFNKLDTTADRYDDDIIGEPFDQEYSHKVVNGIQEFSITINPSTALCGGLHPPGFGRVPTDQMRHNMFKNIIKLRIIRLDTKDTITLTPSLISDFTTPFGKHHTGLVFD